MLQLILEAVVLMASPSREKSLAVKKFAINKNADPWFQKDNIRFTGQTAKIFPVAIPSSSKLKTELYLWLCVLAPDRCHIQAPIRRRLHIHS